MPLKIETITAYVATDKEGNEGIMGFLGPDGAWIPMIGADQERLKSAYAMAEQISALSGLPFRVLQFSTVTDITEPTKHAYGSDARN